MVIWYDLLTYSWTEKFFFGAGSTLKGQLIFICPPLFFPSSLQCMDSHLFSLVFIIIIIILKRKVFLGGFFLLIRSSWLVSEEKCNYSEVINKLNISIQNFYFNFASSIFFLIWGPFLICGIKDYIIYCWPISSKGYLLEFEVSLVL